jgi:hypothetical protein
VKEEGDDYHTNDIIVIKKKSLILLMLAAAIVSTTIVTAGVFGLLANAQSGGSTSVPPSSSNLSCHINADCPSGEYCTTSSNLASGLSCQSGQAQTEAQAPGCSSCSGNYLSGDYKTPADGRYYIRQIGNTVWWVGKSSDNGLTFTNVFKGIIQGTTIVGDWADVGLGSTHSGGTLTVQITGSNFAKISLSKISQTGGFGDSSWEKFYPDCIDNPCRPSDYIHTFR